MCFSGKEGFRLNTEIFELSEEEVLAIAGADQIAPQATMQTSIYPEVDNEPPLPPG